MKLRNYQDAISKQATEILQKYRIVYLAMEPRCGKTATAIQTAFLYGAKKVLFITKKKAIQSIQNDYNLLKAPFELVIVNNESLHKVSDNDFDLLISDEHHRVSGYPKPSKTAKDIKKRFAKLPMIFLSGTSAVESSSQYYHQFWVSNATPFAEKNFYLWAREYVNVKIKQFGQLQIKDYSEGNYEKIQSKIKHLIITYTQKQAGFDSEVKENILWHEVKTKNIIQTLQKDRIVQGTNEVILADAPAKLMSKMHQLEGGTIIFESGNSQILDTSKAEFINEKFKGKKIAVFYYFQKELDLLKNIIDNNTTDLEEFQNTDKNLIIQQYSGAEGITLKQADFLVFYSFGYSGVKFIQSLQRMSTKDRAENNVFFVFEKGSLSHKIYKVVSNKKTFSERIFIKEYEGAGTTNQDY